MGIFDEGKEQEALSCLRMMEFDGRDELIGRITASMGLREKLDELQKYKALALAFARRYRPDMAAGLTGESAPPVSYTHLDVYKRQPYHTKHPHHPHPQV